MGGRGDEGGDDGLGAGSAAKAVGGEGDKLKGDFHAGRGGARELGQVGVGKGDRRAGQSVEKGNGAEVFGRGLADTGRKRAGGKHLDRAMKGRAADGQGECAGAWLGGAEGTGGSGRVRGVQGEGGQVGDKVGLGGGIAQDVLLACVEANGVKRLKDDDAFGGGLPGVGDQVCPRPVHVWRWLSESVRQVREASERLAAISCWRGERARVGWVRVWARVSAALRSARAAAACMACVSSGVCVRGAGKCGPGIVIGWGGRKL